MNGFIVRSKTLTKPYQNLRPGNTSTYETIYVFVRWQSRHLRKIWHVIEISSSPNLLQNHPPVQGVLHCRSALYQVATLPSLRKDIYSDKEKGFATCLRPWCINFPAQEDFIPSHARAPQASLHRAGISSLQLAMAVRKMLKASVKRFN